MKNILLLAIFSATLFLLPGCNSSKLNQSKPDKVALAFLRNFAKLDMEKTKPLCTKEGAQALGMLETILAGASEEDRLALQSKANAEIDKFKSATCRTEGDEAHCKICCDEEGNESDDEPIKLKKIGGKWYVDLDKSSMMGGGDMPD